MKLMWFHLMPYTELPDDFREKHHSVWVDSDHRNSMVFSMVFGVPQYIE